MKLSPAWFLFLFAPITVEYLTGSSPYLNPFVLLANLLLYGAGTLLIRELKVRWRKGWSAIFLMAPAYLIAEEGLMLNTLFDPTRNTVGRWLGVNWVWATGMITFWIVVSPLTALAKRNPGLLVLALLMSALLWNLRKRLIEETDAVPPLTPTTA